MGGRGSPGGGRGRGTVGLGRLFLYLLLPSSPRLALTLPLSSFRFCIFACWFLLARCGERFGAALTAVKAVRFVTLVSSLVFHCLAGPASY